MSHATRPWSAALAAAGLAGPLRTRSGSHTEGKRILFLPPPPPQKGVSGLSHDSMCGRPWSPLCWDVSIVVLFFCWSFWFCLFSTCTSVFLLFVPLVCLSVDFDFFRASFWDFYFAMSTSFSTNAQNTNPLTPTPSLSLSPSLTITHTPTNLPPPPSPHTHTASPTLCFAASLPLQLLTDFLVFLQSRKASEQAKSVDSKTDSIGSGRAIPIKQVSRLPHSSPTFLVDSSVSGIPCLVSFPVHCWCAVCLKRLNNSG